MDSKIKAMCFQSLLAKEDSSLVEAIGDNSVDNMISELRRATEKELEMFVCSLLPMVMRQFASSYTMPNFEDFRKVLYDIADRFNVMDAPEKGDVFVKIENMFKDIFVKNYSDLGPDKAQSAAVEYAKQMISFLKANQVQSNKSIFSQKTIF